MAAKDPRSDSSEPRDGPGRPAKADWRRPVSRSAPSTAARKKGGPIWRVRPDRPYEDARRWYRIRLASWVLLATAMFIALVVILLYWPRRTPMVAMAVTEYGNLSSWAVPPNGWANEDVEGLADLDGEKIIEYANARFVMGKAGEKAFDELREKIRNRVQRWTLRRYPIIVYLSVHGVVNEKGEPCLLLPGGVPTDSDQWLPLETLIGYLFPADAAAELPAKKLLILDCNRMDVNFRLGLLYNSFADGLADVAKKTPGLAILNSTGPGQIGWTSPEQLHGSVFGYFVRQGLRGAADRRDEGGDGDGEVSLREFHSYVAKQVRQWVLEHRADVQEPALFTEESDFFLVHAKHGPPTEIPQKKFESEARWTGDLDRLWIEHNRLRAASPWRVNPLGWEEFQQGLLRLEALAAAGPGYDEEYATLRDELSAKAKTVADPGLPRDLSLASLALRTRLASPVEALQLAAEQKALIAQWNAKEQRFLAEPGRTSSYLGAAAEAWRRCVLGVESERWSDLLQFVDAPGRPGRPGADVVEIHFLRMLSAHMDPEALKDHRPAVERALAARDLAEQAAAPRDERAHYWIQAAVDQADAARRKAEDLLFVGSPEAVREAERALDALVSSDRQGGAYPRAAREAERVAKAFALRDRAWAEIPYYVRWLLDRQRPQSERSLHVLRALIDNAHALGEELDRAILRRSFSPAWESAHKAVEDALGELEREYKQECAWLWERAPLHRETQQRISVVLSVPLVSGEDRSRLWRTYWEIAQGKRSESPGQESAAKTGDKPAAEADGKGTAFRVGGEAKPDATEAYLKRLPPTHPLLAVLSRGRLGVEDPPCLALASAAAAARDSDELPSRLARLARQGQCVRHIVALGSDCVKRQCDAWMAESASRLDSGDRSPGETREGRAKADRLLRAAAPLLDLARSPWPKPDDDPPHQLRRLDLHYLLLWHAYRTLEDFWGPWPPRSPDDPPEKDGLAYFITVADQYLTSASALAPSVKRLRYDNPALKEAVNLRELLDARRKACAKVVKPMLGDLSIKRPDAAASKTQTAMTPGEIGAEVAENLPEGTAAFYLRDPAASDRREQTIPVFVRAGEGQIELRRIGAPLQPGQRVSPRSFTVKSEDPRLQHHPLYAVALYRGHAQWTPFSATEPDYVLQYVPPRYDPPTITVWGETVEEPCPVMFVLDCSGSMTQDILDPWEPRAGQRASAAAEFQRFEVAKHALKQILQRLAKSEIPFDVGLIVYGHRVGWDRDPASRKDVMVVWDPKNPGATMPRPASFGIIPSEDVEVLRSPAPFGPTELASLTKDLDALRPLGETPLYLAIQKAVEQLQGKTRSGESARRSRRHILVITDGMNEVFGTEGKRVYKSDLSELFQRPENRDITLDVIGFNLSDWDLLWQRVLRSDNPEALKQALSPRKEKGENAMAAAASVDAALAERVRDFRNLRHELEQLVQETKHEAGAKGFYPVAGASGISQVMEALQASLRVRRAKYSVQRVSDGRTVASADLQETTTLKDHVGVERYRIQLGSGDRQVSTEVTLEGGEAELLFLSKDGTRLEHQRYDKNLRVMRDNVPDPADPENRAKRYFVGAHIPDWKGRDVQFWISIQNQDPARFSPRPKEAWIQVRPLGADEAARPVPYIVYDMTFEQRVPAPVLTFLAPNWPQAEEAEIQLWFKFEKTRSDPREGIPLDELRKRGEWTFHGETISAEARPAEPGSQHVEVVVKERYGPKESIPSVRVEMDPPPEKITRQHHAKAGMVLHTFYYDAGVGANVGTFRVLLTPHGRLVEGAITLPVPLRIALPRQNR